MPKRTHPAENRTTTSNRIRAYAACTECRRRKRKCDGNLPCFSCNSHGYICHYAEVPRDSGNSPNRTGNQVSAPPPPPLPPAASTPVIISKERGRTVNAHSAAALAHLVGRELDADNPPRLHSYAWNLGLRPERRGSISTSLSNYLTLSECKELSAVYFEAVHPLFTFLSKDDYLTDLEREWTILEKNRPNFAAVVAGVAALGSFFSQPNHPREEQIIGHCMSILDLCLSTPVSMVNLDSVAGWILRTLYLRLTTRPAIAFMASHTAVHLSEIMGLHRCIPETGSINGQENTGFCTAETKLRLQHYWVACSLNCLFSVEYGLTPVKLPRVTGTLINQIRGMHVESLVSLAQILESAEETASSGITSQAMTCYFTALQSIPDILAIVALMKAEVCLCMLRRFISSKSLPCQEISTKAVAIFEKALEKTPGLLTAKQPWWNILSVPFQIVCICISVDTSTYLRLLTPAMETLRSIVEIYDSHMAKEALNTAQRLIALSRERTDAKLKLKDSALGGDQPDLDAEWLSFIENPVMMDNWPFDMGPF